MTLKPEQLQFFKENYASVIVDEMEEDVIIEYAIRKIAEEMKEQLDEIQLTLCKMMQAAGLFYTTVPV